MSDRKKYRPSNGCEGAEFMAHFCDRCKRDEAFQNGTGDSCPIAAATMAYGVNDPEYPEEWTRNEEGYPVCTAYEILERAS